MSYLIKNLIYSYEPNTKSYKQGFKDFNGLKDLFMILDYNWGLKNIFR